MNFKTNKEESLSLLLLREELWKLEDKMNVVMESEADHEADLIRLKRMMTLLSNRIDSLDPRKATKFDQNNDYGR